LIWWEADLMGIDHVGVGFMGVDFVGVNQKCYCIRSLLTHLWWLDQYWCCVYQPWPCSRSTPPVTFPFS